MTAYSSLSKLLGNPMKRNVRLRNSMSWRRIFSLQRQHPRVGPLASQELPEVAKPLCLRSPAKDHIVVTANILESGEHKAAVPRYINLCGN